MFTRKTTLNLVLCLVTVCATLSATAMASGLDKKTTLIADEVRHQLVMLPYYGVFDWLDAQVLPLSSFDDQIRLATYRAIFKYNSPLFQYAIRAVPPIHIIVKNGQVTLKGVVASDMDRQLANMAARGVPGVFDVKNELTVDNT